jgi:NAD(P)-dependent dehydrogenase (short-subunit alcohol dehydrogenase family)
MDMNNQTQKIALITGGSRGLGRNTAESLARKGVDVVITYRSQVAEAQAAVASVQAVGRKAVALQLDTAVTATFPAFVETLRKALQDNWSRDSFDCLVNNAGTSHHAAFDKVTEEDLDGLYQVHVKGVFFLTQGLLPLLKDGGRIVMLSSGTTRIIFPGSGAYASMKGAIEILALYLAKELGPRRIAVNTVAPGAIATDFSGGMVRDNPEVNKIVAGMTALGRAGLPDDIGPMIASLLSEDNRWVNAQRIEVSGGMSI